MKYRVHVDSEIRRVESIHAMWLIDENAIIFRILIWLNPITVLTNSEAIITVIINWVFILLFINSIIGAIFCQVNKMIEFIHLRPSITSGNQKWNGAAPSFVSKAVFNIKLNVKFIRGLINSFVINIIITAIRSTSDAIACVMKYLSEDSEE